MRLPYKPIHLWWTTLTLTTFFVWYVTRQSVDPDFWWRLVHGQDISAHGISLVDHYSYTMPSFSFVSHAWLFDLSMAHLWKHLSYSGITLLVCCLTSITLGIVTFRMRFTWLSSIGIIGFWAISLISFGVRAQVVAWPFIAYSIWLYLLPQEKWLTWRWSALPVILLWANVHGSFPLLIALIGLRFIVRGVTDRRLDWVDILIAVVATLLTLLNPYGIHVWREIWLTNSDPQIHKSITEWFPVWRSNATITYFVALGIGLGTALATIRKNWLALVLIIFTGLAAISSVRHIPILSFSTLFVILTLFPTESWHSHWKNIAKDRRLARALLLLAIIFALSLAKPFVAFERHPRMRVYPEQAVQLINTTYPNAVVFNYYDWGGYLIWARPGHGVFVDGRMPSWRWTAPPGELDWAYKDFLAIKNGDTVLFTADAERFHIDTVLWPTNGTTFLKKLPDLGWHKMYEDTTAVVYRK